MSRSHRNTNKSKNSRLNSLRKLSDLKYEHDKLTNELFHLKEFVSLVEFDPLYRETSENFNRFIQENNLEWNKLYKSKETDQDVHEKLEDKTVRRPTRHLRENTTGASKDDLTQAQKDIQNQVDFFVDQKYDELKKKYILNMDKKKSLIKKPHIKREQSNDIKKEISKEVVLKHEPPVDELNSSSEFNENIPGKTIDSQSNNFKLLKGPELKYQSDLYDENYIKSESDYYFTTSSEDEEFFNRRKPPKKKRKINVILHPPKLTVTNPDNIAKPIFNSLEQYLESFKMLEDDMSNEDYTAFIEEQKKIAKMIKQGIDDGILRYDSNSESVQPLTKKTPHVHLLQKADPIQYMYKEQHLHTYQDHLINQGIFMSKLYRNNRKARIAGAKKIAQMIEQHFKHIAGAEERRIKEEEKVKKALGRTMIQALKKRWTLAEKAYRVLKKDEDEQLKRIRGKEHLSRMLEKSSQLLGAQLNRTSEEKSGSDIDSDDESSNSDSSENFTSSSSDSDNEELQRLIEDQKEADSLIEDYGASDIKSLENLDPMEQQTSDLNNEVLSIEDKNDTSRHTVGLEALITNNFEKEEEENGSEESVDFEMTDSESSNFEDENLSDDTNVSATSVSEREELEQSTTSDENEFTKNIDDIKDADPLSVEDVPVPSLLRGELRTYQKQGLNWLASLYNNKTNGILADEMGLGKTIQTISLLTYLACEKQNWGPHLIIVPTSVLLNWEMEFKRFAPGFKVLTYYGTPQQRKEKRRGWNKPDAFHVCIVSYQLVVQDQHSFKRKKWQYMVLDEAHNIKNFRSTRWQALLNFNTQRRLLLTGTPLQNNIAELWSLLYFLMPKTIIDGKQVTGFADLDAFQQWFGRPVDKIIETGSSYEQDNEARRTVEKLHQVLRPYLLRRLKAEVEKQIPGKYEHVVYCKLSKRQRFLYDDFMSRAQTKATLASGNFMSIVNCLMQLRKVCNHPDLFEVRPIRTSFLAGKSVTSNYSLLSRFMLNHLHEKDDDTQVNLSNLNFIFTKDETNVTSHTLNSISKLSCIKEFVEQVNEIRSQNKLQEIERYRNSPINFQNIEQFYESFSNQRVNEKIDGIKFLGYINRQRCNRQVMYGKNLIKLLADDTKEYNWEKVNAMNDLIKPLQTRLLNGKASIEKYAVITPSVITSNIGELSLGLDDYSDIKENVKQEVMDSIVEIPNPFHQIQTKLTIAFPDKSLLQYDCGKLQKLAILLQQLKDNGHRALIFTQMTKVLDILEQFLNYHGYLYMRLDGATKIEDRQILTERFNSDPKITVFILSSRSGGLGINLTGADTVIFYDSDWNPAMDKQCQDRCHRIGQTRDVHIYRFVSEHTIESNILKKANQKRQLDDVIIQKGEFTTDYFSKLSVKDLFGSDVIGDLPSADTKPLLETESDANKDPKKLEKLLAQAEDEDDVRAANLAMREVNVDDDDFQENGNTKKPNILNGGDELDEEEDQYDGTGHVEEYMIRLIANGYYY